MNDLPIFLRPYLTIHPSYTTFEFDISTQILQTSSKSSQSLYAFFLLTE